MEEEVRRENGERREKKYVCEKEREILIGGVRLFFYYFFDGGVREYDWILALPVFTFLLFFCD